MPISTVFLSRVLVFLFVGSGLCLQALAATVPTINYVVSGGVQNRHLIFVNNPEEIHASAKYCDVADAISVSGNQCGVSLFRHFSVMGSFRNWFEHTNKTSRELSYGVRLYNPGPQTAVVSIQGVGTNSDSVSRGGDEFVQLFAGVGKRTFEIPPGKSAWLTRISKIPVGKFFVGAIDFSVSHQPLILDNLAYFSEPAPSTIAMGFTERVLGNVREGLVYKGVASGSEAWAQNVDFQFDDADGIGNLNVKYRRLLLPADANYAECLPSQKPFCQGHVGELSAHSIVTPSWITHIAPDPFDANPKRKLAVVSDMVSFWVPGLPNGCVLGASDEPNECFEVSHRYLWKVGPAEEKLFPNLGNWAVHYKVSGVLKNTGSRARTVHFGLKADGNSPIAYRSSASRWQQKALKKASQAETDYFPYGVFVVPAGASVPYSVELVLSGPGAGTLENLVRLTN